MSNATTLAISHNLFLTKEERYNWYAGEPLEVIGVSIPVWFYKGISSEPAIEVFCKYKLINKSEEIFIKHNENGYNVTVPQGPVKEFESLPDEIWDAMSVEEQEKWYEENEPTPSLKMLLDIKDGGGAYLAFRQYSKIRKTRTKILNVVHFMEIKDIQDLTQSLV